MNNNTKVRVHELAKEIDKSTKEVLDACKKLGIQANSSMNVLTDKEVENLKKELLPPPPKKRMTAVFRPQNSAQQGARRPNAGGPRPEGRPAGQGARPRPANAEGGQAAPRREGAAPVQKPQEVTAASQSEGAPQEAAALAPKTPQAAAAGKMQNAAAPAQPQAEKPAPAQPQAAKPAPAQGQAVKPAPAQPQAAKPAPAPAPKASAAEGAAPAPKAAAPAPEKQQAAPSREAAKQQNAPAREAAGTAPAQAAPKNRPQNASSQQGGTREITRPQQNRDGGGRSQNGANAQRDGARPQSRDGQRGQGQGTGRTRDGQAREGARPQSGTRPQSSQGTPRDGQRSQGTGRPRDGGARPQSGQGYSRDAGRPQGGQGYSRDGARSQGGTGYSRDGQRSQGYSRDAGRTQGGTGYSRDGQRSQGTYNRDGARTGTRPFDKDGAAGRTAGAGNDARTGARSPRGGESVPMGKPTSKPAAKQTQKPKTNTRQDRRHNEEQETAEMFLKKRQKPGARGAKTAPAEEEIKTLVLPDKLTVKELADLMKVQASAIVKKLFMAGKMVTINDDIDYDQAEEICMDYDILCEHEEKVDVIAELLKDTEDDPATLEKRPPVVCVMGHVDHGKTSLLDAIRSTHVTDREAGGITQHIGAYVVDVGGEKITFLDTPGHEAFTAMRMRGAQSTDIAILVVAADDGVMPQTVEAISHAKAAGVDIIVAINKIDKPGANVDRVKQELTEYELVPEDWGGSTICVPVSAKTKEGLDTLLEMILLEAEVKELKANPNRLARGIVIEAKLDKGKGPVATVLVQKGTLHVGDTVAVGSCYGKVRAMMDDQGKRVKAATPSMPVEILGLNDVPGAGEVFVATPTEKDARAFAETFISQGKEKLLEETRSKMSLDDLFNQIQAGNVKELNIIIKADVQGSVEAIRQSLLKLSNDEVVVKIIHGGVGAISESDVTLAATTGAIIIGFNVRPDASAKDTADREKVDVRLYNVIYQAIDDVEAAMKGMLDPIYEEQVIGHGVVRQLFKASGVGTIAGSYVTDGKFQRGGKVRISRGGKQIFEGNLASLKRFKDDVKEVARGYECGLVCENFNDLAVDDEIEEYIMVEVPR